MRRRSAARRGDRGAAVVEFAIVLPVLMMLLLGMVSGANAWNQSQSMGHGGQVAARFASTLPVPDRRTEDMDDWLDDVIDRAIAASAGTMDAGTRRPSRSASPTSIPPGRRPDKTVQPADERRRHPHARAPPSASPTGRATTAKRVQVVMERDGHARDRASTARPCSSGGTVVYRFEADGGL